MLIKPNKNDISELAVLRQAIFSTNARMMLFGPLEIKFSEILIEIDTFSFKKMGLKMSPVKWRSYLPSLNI